MASVPRRQRRIAEELYARGYRFEPSLYDEFRVVRDFDGVYVAIVREDLDGGQRVHWGVWRVGDGAHLAGDHHVNAMLAAHDAEIWVEDHWR